MEPERRPSTVLVVDDESMVRKLTATLLRAAGYRVLEAHDASSALALATEHLETLDLLLTDVSMPGRSGVDLARDLAPLRPDLPVVFMSGYCELSLELEGRGAELLGKPFSPAALIERVRVVLEHAGHAESAIAFA